ncbi:uncharacterized protein LOC111086652 [Limulus polyphemus]|uniref:Uncharacterized protein LOC111086652 n=1 Tax=Limulus polyphemus TaxID=6850 RepID=A0ABM1SR40_LIMPO|nr:uncharacterized protein LOC111086652 [Limulus polyphemus]XP_022246096.1 uncharacterized protein LOC111086652 [Limulus polyphemus]
MRTTIWLAFISVLYLTLPATTSKPTLMSSQLKKIARLVIPYVNKVRGYAILRPGTAEFTVRTSDSTGQTGVKQDDDDNEVLPDAGITDFEDGDLDDLHAPHRRFDDYGHMRFGRSGPAKKFDDYGHMRFGK